MNKIVYNMFVNIRKYYV